MQKQHLKLTKTDRKELETLLSDRSLTVKIHDRIQVLLGLDSGKSFTTLSKEIGFTHGGMRKICNKYIQRVAGSDAMSYLSDKPRSGRPINISGPERAKITALACSQAPDGHLRWTLRLLSDKIVELGICESISHTQVGVILKKTSYNLISNANGA